MTLLLAYSMFFDVLGLVVVSIVAVAVVIITNICHCAKSHCHSLLLLQYVVTITFWSYYSLSN